MRSYSFANYKHFTNRSNGTQRIHPDGMPVPFFFQAPTATNFEVHCMRSCVYVCTCGCVILVWVVHMIV